MSGAFARALLRRARRGGRRRYAGPRGEARCPRTPRSGPSGPRSPSSPTSPSGHKRRDETDDRTGARAAETRIREQALWVDLQIKQAMERGDFDNLPGQGKPLGDLGSPDDRDWWLRKLIERERITGVLPAALQLRKDDARARPPARPGGHREAGARDRRGLQPTHRRGAATAAGRATGGDADPRRRGRGRALARAPSRTPTTAAGTEARSGAQPAAEKPRRRWFRRRS